MRGFCNLQIVHESVYDEVTKRLVAAYQHIKVGNPLNAGVLCGPLHTKRSTEIYANVCVTVKSFLEYFVTTLNRVI